MQTLIQNDLNHLQTSLVAYQTKISLYRQVQAKAKRNVLYDKQVNSPSAQLKKLAQKGGGMLAMIGAVLVLEKSSSLVEDLVGEIGGDIDNAEKDVQRTSQ